MAMGTGGIGRTRGRGQGTGGQGTGGQRDREDRGNMVTFLETSATRWRLLGSSKGIRSGSSPSTTIYSKFRQVTNFTTTRDEHDEA